MAKARLLGESGNHKGAIANWTAAIAALPQDSEVLAGRGVSYALAGQNALADKDFAAARAAASEAGEFNSMCWAKATAGVVLESALNDCDTALAKRPDFPPYLDTRALVLLRLGRIDDAIAEYSRALAKQPKLASSLFGRAVAWGRKGEKAKSEAGVAAALKVNPDVRSNYESYGIKL
jgi:tetratricopeptide (TPR) repeat protein